MKLRLKIALWLESLRRNNLKKIHPLQQLFWESTLRCNVHCLHCGSDCVSSVVTPDMPAEDFLHVIDTEITPHVDPHQVLIIISGGEPLMRKDLAEIGRALHQRGYPWGMVTNGLALTEKKFHELLNAGLRSITVSCDGLEADHIWLRQHPLAFEGATRAIKLITDFNTSSLEGRSGGVPPLAFDVVTCVNQRNIDHLPAIRDMLWSLGVHDWRIFGIDPMGRAASNPELLIDDRQFRDLLDFIVSERQAGRHVSYSCEGYLGDYEGRVRDHLYQCAAGISIASILIDGSISACTSIRGKYYQGNIYRDSFWDVWEHGFESYRNRSWMKQSEPCKDCKAFTFCEGNGMHLRREDGSLMICHLRRLALFFVMAIMLACSSPSAESLYLQGRHFRENNQPVEAMSAFIDATRVHSREYAFKARSFSNMATMCRMAEQHELALSLYEQSFQQFTLARDTLAQAYALNNMAWENAVLGNKPEALLLIDSALSLCHDTAVLHKVIESRVAAYLYAADYDSVLLYAHHAPIQTTYLDIILAQAYDFMDCNDSALFYARRVCEQTTNPRYLDDALYILTHCNEDAQADDIRSLASSRADIQRSLERNNPEWMEAVQLAQAALQNSAAPLKPRVLALIIAISVLILTILTILFFLRRRKERNSLDNQCRLLRNAANLREELQWNNYPLFCKICNERLGNIAAKLEQRGLSERDIRICVLVLIGLSYAQMAEVLFRAESGIGKDKYLIAKQLGVSVKDLQQTLFQIANEPLHA